MSIIRRAVLAIALIAGISPAIAQVPPPVPALPDTERRTSYVISGSTCACSVNFQLYGDSTDYQNWVEVWLNGVRLTYNDPTFGWKITSPTGSIGTIARPITDAVLTFNGVQTGTVQIVGARRPRRTSQFAENRGVAARDLNQVITDLTAQNRETWDKINDVTGRAVVAPPGETLAVLPKLSGRASMNACFDSSGNLTSCIAAASGSFAAGNGIAFSGVSPTTITNNIAAGAGITFAGTNPIVISTASKLLTPQDYGAVCDGSTDDHTALQNWADALRDGGLGASPSILGCVTSATITFMPSTNVAPVQGPHIVGNLKLIGHASLPLNSDLLRVWNPTAITTSQNFYFARFDSLELSTTTGTGDCLSLRGYWGVIGSILGTNCGGDVVDFPNFIFGGIPDEYESNPNLGNVTGIGMGGFVINNNIGIGASFTAGNVRGTTNTVLTAGSGAMRISGSVNHSGMLAYTGGGWAVKMNVAGIGAQGHEVFSQGLGDIDCAQNGVSIETMEFATFTGHRMNIEPAVGGPCNQGVVWPITAYAFGKATLDGRVVGVTVNPYITVRPGVTFAGFTLIDFNNDPNLSNLVINLTISDQTGTLAAQAFGTLYKNISSAATIRIVQNGVVMYDNTQVTTFASLRPCVLGLRGVHFAISDSSVTTFGSVAAAGGANVVPVMCNGSNWVVG